MLSVLDTETRDTKVENDRLQASLKDKAIKLRHLKCNARVLANYKPLIDPIGATITLPRDCLSSAPYQTFEKSHFRARQVRLYGSGQLSVQICHQLAINMTFGGRLIIRDVEQGYCGVIIYASESGQI